MALSDTMTALSPDLISVDRENRQRKTIDTDGLRDSIARNGIINPLIVTRDNQLVAGERRLQAARELGFATVPVRYLDTLDLFERRVLELEENLKRKELSWREYIAAVGELHSSYCALDSNWTQHKTGEVLSISQGEVAKILRVYHDLNSKKLENATTFLAAYNMLCRSDERMANSIIAELVDAGTAVFSPAVVSTEATDAPEVQVPAPQEQDAVQVADFLDWADTYNGPRFNLLHCDFPYGVNVFGGKQGRRNAEQLYSDGPDAFDLLLNSLCENFDKLMAHSCHVMFWFSMQHYQKTWHTLNTRIPSLVVNPIPLVWLKSDNAGIMPDSQRWPRQIYETAFLAYRGDHPIVKVKSNAYACNTDRSSFATVKPEPMLRYFFEMLVDSTTRLLDPTCGSASALRAAESLGAASVLGLELDPVTGENANKLVRQFRTLRRISKGTS